MTCFNKFLGFFHKGIFNLNTTQNCDKTVKVDIIELNSTFNSFHFSNLPPECLNLTYSKSNTYIPS